MEQEQRSGFWSSLPGILTGSAALITAATGGYLAYDKASPAMPAPSPSAAEAAKPTPAPELAAVPTKRQPAEAPAVATVQPAGAELPVATVDPPPPVVASVDARPSFDCARAATLVETMICGDTQLADRDRRAAQQYFALRGSLPSGVRTQLLQSQRLFLRQRSDCRSSQCLSDLYDVRLRQLAEFASN